MSGLMGKHKIAVDTGSLSDGDSLASYLVASGALLTSTTDGAKQRLDMQSSMEHLDGAAYAAGSDFLASMGAVDSSGNWKPFTLDATGALTVSATLNEAGDYPEDSAHVSGDVGYFNLSVRRDARSSGVSADGDYASFNVNANGELWSHDQDAYDQLVLANASLDAIEASAASIDGKLSDIYTEQLDQGTSLDSILAELLDQGTTLDSISSDTSSISASATAINSDTSAILAELLDQGTTLDSILADTATIDSQTFSMDATLTSLSKAEDAAHSSGDKGIQSLAVRKDAQGSNVSADGDYASFQQWSEGSMKVVDIANGSLLQQQVTVGLLAVACPASPLANRKTLMLQNTSDKKFYIGSATVTTSGATAGIELPASSFMELEVGPAVPVYAICASAAKTMNVLEMA